MTGIAKESGVFRVAETASIGNLSGHHAHSDKVAHPESELECVIAHLNSICKTATLRFALDVGGVVIRHFYAGKLDLWRNRDRKKDVSLRKLAKHPHLPMSPSALYRSIAIYELCERLGISDWKHISTAHIRLVLPCGPDQQARLLSTAEAERWSVRELDAEVETAMQRQPAVRSAKGGVARLGALQKMMRPLPQFVAAVNKAVETDDWRKFAPELSPDSARETIELLHSVVDACKEVESKLCPAPDGILHGHIGHRGRAMGNGGA